MKIGDHGVIIDGVEQGKIVAIDGEAVTLSVDDMLLQFPQSSVMLKQPLDYGELPAPNLTEKTKQALLKDVKRGKALLFDEKLFPCVPNAHKSPIGITDLNHPIKKPRPFFDATFRPSPFNEAINDWTTASTEHALEFPTAFTETCAWMYNLRISYPNEEICGLDDNVNGAFRLLNFSTL